MVHSQSGIDFSEEGSQIVCRRHTLFILTQASARAHVTWQGYNVDMCNGSAVVYIHESDFLSLFLRSVDIRSFVVAYFDVNEPSAVIRYTSRSCYIDVCW